jgi:hypothetical protein
MRRKCGTVGASSLSSLGAWSRELGNGTWIIFYKRQLR